MHFHFPIELPHENLYGLMSRLMKVNGVWDHLSATQSFLGSQELSVADARLNRVANSLYDRHYLTENGSSGLTFESLRCHLGESSSQITDGDAKRNSTLQNESFGDIAFWRYCPTCRSENIQQYGVAYWHLEHQLPTTLVCLKHSCNLSEIPLKKRQLHDRLWLIDEVIQHGQHFEESYDEYWIKLAEIGSIAIHDHASFFESKVVLETFEQALIERRYLDKQGKLNAAAFDGDFEAFFGEAFVRVLRERLQIKKPRYIANDLTNPTIARTLYRIVLVYWLFGTWEYFKQRCAWNAVFTFDITTWDVTRDNYTNGFETAKHQYRSICTHYLLSIENPNRIAFLQRHYSAFRWLLNNDKAWLDQRLPVRAGLRQMGLDF